MIPARRDERGGKPELSPLFARTDDPAEDARGPVMDEEPRPVGDRLEQGILCVVDDHATPKRSRARGRDPARPVSSTASAASRSRT